MSASFSFLATRSENENFMEVFERSVCSSRLLDEICVEFCATEVFSWRLLKGLCALLHSG